MTYHLIADDGALSGVSSKLQGHSRIALDCEAAGFHRYTDRLCLVQVSTPDDNYLFDPLAIEISEALRTTLEDPEVRVVMHGADFDLRLLHRDLGLRVKGLFDTQTAATLLGATAIGLAPLLDEHLGVRLSKAHQRADWARRPLPESFLQYASDDTRHLLALGEILADGLKKAGREDWAEEEFRFLEGIEWTEEAIDPVTRIKGARHLSPRHLTALRAAFRWRDGIARAWDKAPFRVVGDSVLVDLVMARPASPKQLAGLKGMSPRLAERHGEELLAELERIDGLPDSELQPYPSRNRNGAGRLSPEQEGKADKIRGLRAALADRLGLDKGVLLSNAQIGEIIQKGPSSLEELRALPGVRRWQIEQMEGEILRILQA